jgi:mannose-6-phosphate isomerase-like protein (cupin superfamily)
MEGKGTIVIGEESYAVGPGDIVFSPMQIPHAVKADYNERFSIFVIKTPNLQAITSK